MSKLRGSPLPDFAPTSPIEREGEFWVYASEASGEGVKTAHDLSRALQKPFEMKTLLVTVQSELQA